MRTIPFSPPDITREEIDEVVDTLKSGWITTGPKTKLFETQIAEYCHTTRVVAMNSATACMEMTLRLLGVGIGDEVITSAYTYSASASVIDHVGAKIVLVDTGIDSYQIDYEALEQAITVKTKVIIPVDIAGVMCDYDRILECVEKKKELFKPTNDLQRAFGRVIVLSDAAHSFGAKYKGKANGDVADFTSFSFHAVKNLTTAEGGAITWREIEGIDSDEIYKRLMLLSLHGQTKDALSKTVPGIWEYDIVAPNYKCNMTDIMASIGIVQLRRYPELLKRRKELIELYDKELEPINIKSIAHFADDNRSSGHLYVIRLTNQSEAFRNTLIEKMANMGIATNVHFKPLPLFTAYKDLGFDIREFPNAFDVYKNSISLPLHTLLSNDDVDYVCKSLIELMRTVV